jgi:membrane protease YdiL (CAAX protease family)
VTKASRQPPPSTRATHGAARRGLFAGLLEAPGPSDGAQPLDRRTTFVFICTTVLLIVFQYFGKPESYRGSRLAAALQPVADAWFGSHADVAPYAWWGVASVVIRVVIPLGIVALVFREPLAAYGWNWRGQLAHVPKYAALYVAMLPLLALAAMQPSFQQKYPFYKAAADGGGVFWGYELLYGAQFMGVEVFFRGFLTFALFRRFGYNALPMMAIPYVMVHFNKPLPETFGALGAAFILGYLALRAGSCVLGIFLHWAVGFTMDVLAIGKMQGGLGAALRLLLP